jgi:hypothetical protein
MADDQKITDLNQFQRVIIAKQPNGKVKLKVYRRGKGYLVAT